jgi:sugar/nucleoside kinase (ribokinase family)
MLGHDALSHFVEENLVREGIDTSHVVRRDDASPIHAVIIVAEQGHTRNIFSEPKGRSGSDDELPPADVIASTRVLFIDHYNTPGNLRAMSIAQAAGVPVVADIERDNVPRFDEVLSLVDHVVMSREFALSLTSARHPADAVQALWTGRRAAVVVTGGAEGCWYRDHEYSAVRHLPAFAVDVVDTTGCGDVFHGVYAAALARGAGIEQRVQWASAAAALKATQDGGQRGIPLRAQVEAFLTDRP